jgi:hypothetical protein
MQRFCYKKRGRTLYLLKESEWLLWGHSTVIYLSSEILNVSIMAFYIACPYVYYGDYFLPLHKHLSL